jgi:tetratricopeptide (TPR) repeat protein
VLKRLIAENFVVMIEKGIILKDYNGKLGWVGHYAVVSGYDDSKSEFITQDAYFSPDYILSYDQLYAQWRDFNYTYLVIYPQDQEDRLMYALGNASDETVGARQAAVTASEEALSLSGVQQFFAWFNRGTSLVSLQDYAGAAGAYDQAFALMAALPEDDRPWRIMWYQTGPYFVYYFTGRYQDVINLADNTINSAAEPYLEESFIWRARARAILGDTTGAAQDVRTSLEYHPGFTPGLELAQQLGIQP